MLERLQAVNLARPNLIKELFSLRNDIEHHDGPPPSLARCRELIDLTWYFLKSTDGPSRIRQEGLAYELPPEPTSGPPDDASDKPTLGFTARLVSAPERTLSITGWFAPPYLNAQNEGLALQAHVVRGKPPGPGWPYFDDPDVHNPHSGRGEDERWVEGHMVVPPTSSDRRYA